MSKIIDPFAAKEARVRYTGKVNGEPVSQDAAAIKKRLQQRLQECVLLRKHEEALLLLDALLIEQGWQQSNYWRVLVPLVAQLLPERLGEVIRGANNSLHPFANTKPVANTLFLRYMINTGDREIVKDYLEEGPKHINPIAFKVAAMAEFNHIDKEWDIETRKSRKRSMATSEFPVFSSDSEDYTSDSDEDQPRRDRKSIAKKRRRFSKDEHQFVDDFDDEELTKPDIRNIAERHHTEDEDEGLFEASDDEEEKKTKMDAQWSMPPRLFHMDLTCCNIRQMKKCLDKAVSGYHDLDAVKLRLKFLSGWVAFEQDTLEKIAHKQNYYQALADALLLADNNAPLIRILLPHFSHYSDEWSELMQQYCSLDPTADLEDALKPYERRVRKVVKAAKGDQSIIQERATSMAELLLERVSHGCFEIWTLKKLGKWFDMLHPNTLKAICLREAWLESYLRAESGSATPKVANHLDRVRKQYFNHPNTQ